LFLRERELWGELNSTDLDIPAGATVPIQMNISLSPGVNHLWARLEGPQWLPTPESYEELMITSLPILRMDLSGPEPVLDREDPIDISVFVENLGPWDLNTTFLGPPGDLSDGLGENLPVYDLGYKLTFSEEGHPLMNGTSITALKPGEGRWFNWTIGPIGSTGALTLNISLDPGIGYMIEGWEHQFTSRILQLSSDPDLNILSMAQTMVGESYAKSLDIVFRNPTEKHLQVAHVKIYDGYPGDNKIISEAIILNLGPGEFGNRTMSIPLSEGFYIISVEAEAAVVLGDGGDLEWFTLDQYVEEISLQEPGTQTEPVDEEVDMGEVTTAGIITVSAVMVVLMVSSFFYRREQDEDEDEDQ
jgi:hypothetical protein